jgi:uncharacterized tellurite resistance protein B-like protein
MSPSNPELAMSQPAGCLSRFLEWLRAAFELGRTPDIPFDHAVAALLVHAANLRAPASPLRRARIAALLQNYLGRDQASAVSLMSEARREDDRAVDLHRFARVVNRALSQEGRLAVLEMAARVAFAEDAGAEEEGFLRLLGGLLGISDHDRGIVQHRARQSSLPSASEHQAKETRHV